MTKLLSLSLALSAIGATPVFAQVEATQLNRVVVSTSDLNLASAVGQRALDRRLAQAVVEACGTTSDLDLAGSNDIDRCRAETSANIAANRDRLVQLAHKGSDIILASR